MPYTHNLYDWTLGLLVTYLGDHFGYLIAKSQA